MSPKTKPAKPIAIYTRVSDQGDRSDEELRSHEIQRRKVAAYLEAKGLAASPDTFEDTDRSGGTMSRPAFDRALAGVREGNLGGIGVYHLSRFGRNTVGVLTLIHELEERGAALICLTPSLDTSSPEGEAMLTVFLAFYTLERKQAVVKARELRALKRQEGRTAGGRPPLGYEFELLGEDSNGKPLNGWLVPSDDADIVRQAFDLFDRRELGTPGAVADFLNGHGLRTKFTRKAPEGNLWNAQNVLGFLRREVYTGVRLDGEERIPAAHEPLVDVAVWKRIQRRLAPQGGRQTRNVGDGHVLGKGLCRCGACGAGMTRGLASGIPQLRCNTRGGGHASMTYATAQDWIEGVAFAHAGMVLDRPGSEEYAAAEARLEAAREELRAAEESVGVALPGGPYVEAVASAEDALAALDAPEARLLFPLGARERFDALAVPEKRAALAGLVERVEIRAGRGTASERIAVYFHDGSRHPAEAPAVPAAEEVAA